MANPGRVFDWDSLKNAIEDHLDRTDVDDEGVSAMLIQMAEAHFNRELRVREMVTRDDAFEIATRYEPVPDDFLGVLRFTVDGTVPCPLNSMTLNEMAEERERLRTTGQPRFFSVVGTDFEFLPTPGDTYTGLLAYYKKIPELSGSNTTNWLLTAHPDLYLWCCLVQGEAYFHNDARLGVWKSQLDMGIQSLHRTSERASRGVPIMKRRGFG